jgi:tRNA nucleotidyltransferase (CCA-adding enzyme)
MLLHDIGKPFCKTTDENMTDHFYTHPAISASLAETALKELKVSNELYERVILLIKYHDGHILNNKKSIKRWLCKIGADRTLDLIEVKKADMLAQNTALTMSEIDELEQTRGLTLDIINQKEVFNLKSLAVNGNDLLSLGLKGKQIGSALNLLLEKVIDEKIENDKNVLISYIEENIL